MSRILPMLLCLAACDDRAFSLGFEAVHDGRTVDCASPLDGVGPADAYTVSLADVRFYVSRLELLDEAGEVVPHTLDEDAFQLVHPACEVALVDLTGTEGGACAADGITFAEGTPGVHPSVTGRVEAERIARVRFDVGVPQRLMGTVISEHTLEGAPAPLDQMYWSWASGYRHFVLNVAVDGPEDGEGYVHVGSRDCSDGALALDDRARCGFVNTARVDLALDPTTDTVAVDLGRLLEGLDFRAPVYDFETFEVLGEQTGVECHSAPSQPHCRPVFDALGIAEDGSSRAADNSVFGVR